MVATRTEIDGVRAAYLMRAAISGVPLTALTNIDIAGERTDEEDRVLDGQTSEVQNSGRGSQLFSSGAISFSAPPLLPPASFSLSLSS